VKHRRALLIVSILLLLGGGGAYWWHINTLEHSQDGPIWAAAQRYSVPPELVKAVVWRESYFNPNARGRAGELGLMQVREDAAQEWADTLQIEGFEHEHCLNPRTNTMAGTCYLRKLLRRYTQTDNPLPYALADYNAGRGNVLKWITAGATNNAATNSVAFIEQIRFPGTRHYIETVLRRYDHYRAAAPPPPQAPAIK
jgi:soluble lytic murein transglycosylase